ncbi:hypothetical protein [uncultured Tenacibaculum sp.]|uniref:hypothetical protein n=1 Tax=uncultured Tenacibaculum sp. TaxID=174713 RepID=UPI002603B88B|nr:hypothetical protein [uncultured Tenacibaculum sp.]
MSTLKKIDGITVTKGATKAAPEDFPDNNYLIPPKNVVFIYDSHDTLSVSIDVEIDSNSTTPPTLNTINNEFKYIQYFVEYDYPYEKPKNVTTWTLTGQFSTFPSPSPIATNTVEVFTRDENNDIIGDTDDPKTSRGTKVAVKSGTGEI